MYLLDIDNGIFIPSNLLGNNNINEIKVIATNTFGSIECVRSASTQRATIRNTTNVKNTKNLYTLHIHD